MAPGTFYSFIDSWKRLSKKKSYAQVEKGITLWTDVRENLIVISIYVK
jgi:hypothetical protein